MVLGGNEFMSVWTRDSSLSAHSFSHHLFYAKALPKNVFAHGLLEMPVEQIIQSEVSRDGRSIICLEQDNSTKRRDIKIWYNSANIDISLKKKAYCQDPLKMNKLEKMECFVLPQNRSKILYFKQIRYNLSLAEGSEEMLPIAFLAVTKDNKALLWVEDLFLAPNYELPCAITFTCLHTFSCKHLNDLCFMKMSQNSIHY